MKILHAHTHTHHEEFKSNLWINFYYSMVGEKFFEDYGIDVIFNMS